MAAADSCKGCRFGGIPYTVEDEKNPTRIPCRRFPPQVCVDNDGVRSQYPIVLPEFWCGEFKRKAK